MATNSVNSQASDGFILPYGEPIPSALRFHHIAIQTGDLDNCAAWYRDFFGGHISWSLTVFSELTLRRLPGIRRLIEVMVGDIRLHLFECGGSRGTPAISDTCQFQHVCVSVESHIELMTLRDRWLELFTSGRYDFAQPDQPTAIVGDGSGSESFYAFDVNGLELEFTYEPGGVD